MSNESYLPVCLCFRSSQWAMRVIYLSVCVSESANEQWELSTCLSVFQNQPMSNESYLPVCLCFRSSQWAMRVIYKSANEQWELSTCLSVFQSWELSTCLSVFQNQPMSNELSTCLSVFQNHQSNESYLPVCLCFRISQCSNELPVCLCFRISQWAMRVIYLSVCVSESAMWESTCLSVF